MDNVSNSIAIYIVADEAFVS